MVDRRSVWIRGVGVVSGLGDDWPSTAAALARGRSNIAPIARFDTTGMPCTVASTVDIEMGDVSDHGDRRSALAVRAVEQAWSTADVDVARDRLGVFVGAESGLTCFAAAFGLAHVPDGAITWSDPRRTSASAVAWAIAKRLGAAGPARTVSLACASGTAAIVEAIRALQAGTCDAAVCAGVGADVDPLKVAAFGRLGALSTRGRSAPFDAGRDGFVLGEGAAAIVLAIERGAARVELVGGARTFDGGSLAAPDPASDGARRAIVAALDDAHLPPSAIGYVAAHGTSTPAGDAAEARALRSVFAPEGVGVGGVRVGAIKGALGHWIAGSGTLGAICAWHAVEHDELLPTIGVERIADDCALPHVLHVAEHARIDAALACSFGFGGANACVVVRRAA